MRFVQRGHVHRAASALLLVATCAAAEMACSGSVSSRGPNVDPTENPPQGGVAAQGGGASQGVASQGGVAAAATTEPDSGGAMSTPTPSPVEGGTDPVAPEADSGAAPPSTNVVAPVVGPLSGNCTDLTPTGAEILTVFMAGPPPDLGQGGTIVDGTYDLVATTIYQSEPTTDRYYERASIRISGGATRIENVNSSADPLVETIVPEAASLNPTTTCGGSGRSFGPYYTATPGQFELVNGLYTELYTLRP
jgi:hypothetical protein